MRSHWGKGSIFGLAALLAACSAPPPEPTVKASEPQPALVAGKPPVKEASGRAAVQHGYDADISRVNRTPSKISVEQLLAMRKKVGDNLELAAYPNKRVEPFETTTFQIDATIKTIKHEKDGDFYFVIQGDTGAQAVVEVPDPALCKDSPMLAEITSTRKALDGMFHPTEENKTVNTRATIEGVGYLGSRKRKGSGSFGASPRLMPGTGVTFPGKS